MKKILILTTLMIALISTACQSIPVTTSTAAPSAAPIDEHVKPEILTADPTQIKSSTLLIVVESVQPSGVKLVYSMGTLVQYQGELFVVTHNHYKDYLQDMNLIELRDAENGMILPIYASEFKKLIIYQDAGTMVLLAPDGVANALTPASLDVAPQLKPGDTVQVAYHRQSNRDKVEVLEAVIEEVDVSAAEPVVTLRSLNGELIRPGDSGGGVWYNGKLVANTWSVLTTHSALDASGNVDPASQTLTGLSNAAIFPEGFK